MIDKYKHTKPYKFVYKYLYLFLERYLTNVIFKNFPSWRMRRLWLRLMGLKIQNKSHIDMNAYFLAPRYIWIGSNTHINQGCFLDGRGNLVIGDNVSISHYVKLCTGGHDVNSSMFDGEHGKIEIQDYCWVGIGATILKGVQLGKGCVVAAGSVVTKNVKPFEIVGGVPAKVIGHRTQDLKYHPLENEHFFRYL